MRVALRRTNQVAIVTASAIVTTAVVAATRSAGWRVVAAFIAGAGMAATVQYIIMTNIAIRRAAEK